MQTARWELNHLITSTLFSKRFVKSSSSRRFSSCSLRYFFLVILRLLSARPRTVRVYHHLHTYYLFRGRHLSPRLRRFQIRPSCFLQRFAHFPCQISFLSWNILIWSYFFLPSGVSDDFLSATNGLYWRSSECIDTRVPESSHGALLWARRHSYQQGGLTAIK